MDLSHVLAQLRHELENLDAAILSLERLQSASRRGRPPKALAAAGKSDAPADSKTGTDARPSGPHQRE